MPKTIYVCLRLDQSTRLLSYDVREENYPGFLNNTSGTYRYHPMRERFGEENIKFHKFDRERISSLLDIPIVAFYNRAIYKVYVSELGI